MPRETKAARTARLAEQAAKDERIRQEVYKAAREGCPLCGSAVRVNSSITGWFQCSQYGAELFRADSSKPNCYWQQILPR